jgi:hypothetical protein
MATLRAGDFRPGEPVELAVKYTNFRCVAGAFGPQAMLKTSLGTLYLDPELASNIETQMRDLAIAPGEKIRVTRMRKASSGFGWEVERIEPTLEQQLVQSLEARNGHGAAGAESPETAKTDTPFDLKAGDLPAGDTTREPAPAEFSFPECAVKEDAQHAAACSVPRPSIPPATAKLMACFMQAIDAVSEAQAYCCRKGLGITFTNEDIRATAISCWISCTRDGGAR